MMMTIYFIVAGKFEARVLLQFAYDSHVDRNDE